MRPRSGISAENACLVAGNGRVKLSKNSSITADNLTIHSAQEINLSGSHITVATDAEILSLNSWVKSSKNSTLIIDGNLNFSGGKGAIISSKSTLDVGGDLKVDAGVGECSINNRATIWYDTKSGNCEEFLP